jgi:hypothetical protein
MNIYKISQKENYEYDTYDSAVVIAETEDGARLIRPGSPKWGESFHWHGDWCNTPDAVTVELIGGALDGANPGVVLASFNAG